MEKVVKLLRKSFNSNLTRELKWRKDQLLAIQNLIDENQEDLCEALKKDLNKPSHETIIMEFGLIKNAITHALNNLDYWAKPQKATPILQARALYSAYTQYQPLGVVLIIGAWNYPYQLVFVPLVGAIASGNCALVKPSELSSNSSQLLEKLWPKYFDTEFIALVNGGVQETQEILRQRFDYIFYTGNTQVGKLIMQAAAHYMTPVTLECGGKSPTYVDDSVDLDVAAKRIAWGKFSNSGQTCVAPDYILCTKEVQVFLKLFKTS